MIVFSQIDGLIRTKTVWVLLCLAVIISLIFLWPVLTEEELEVYVPIRVEKMPPGLTFAQKPLKGIEMKIVGPATLVKTIEQQKLTYPLDLSGLASGFQHLSIEKERLQLPRGASIVSLTPDNLSFRLESRIKKLVPITGRFTGKPAKGFSVATALVKPSMVTLSGPLNLLAPLDHIVTKPVELDGLLKSFKKDISLDLNENIKIHSPPKAFIIEVVMREDVVLKTFDGIPVAGKGSAYPHRISPPSISIDVKGPVLLLGKLSPPKDIQVYIELKGLKPGVYAKRAVINLPTRITLSAARPEVFTAEIKNANQ